MLCKIHIPDYSVQREKSRRHRRKSTNRFSNWSPSKCSASKSCILSKWSAENMWI